MCLAINDWLSGDLANTQVDKKAGDDVGIVGKLTLEYSGQTSIQQGYGIRCYDNSGNAKEDAVVIKNND